MRNLVLCLAVSLLLFGGVTPYAVADTFVFTAIPDENESRLRERFDKVAAYLSKALGVETEYVPVKSYAAAVAAFRNNQVQLAWFGGLSGVRARILVPGSEAIAQGFEDQAFETYFIAHASTGLKRSEDFPKDMADKTFTFGSKGSTSGRLMPEYYIRENFEKAPDEVFTKVGFSGNHSKTIALVQSGAYQVGAVNFKVWQNEMKAGKIDAAKVSIIWKTPPYPDYQWTIRGDVDARWKAGFKQRVKDALLGMTDPDLLASFPRQSFIPATNDDYQPILDVAKQIELID
ncbi:MAG: putative selenate ABC transporter substrate-binding protein [Alphaproteobacteria bacterium]|nr:MAG: putative selenate ABC transporter substrate-binding protein [Alphaproteobacteria bacterium]